VVAAALIGDLPVIAPIGRVSPTLGESLRTCALQVAFRLDDRFKPYRRGGTAAALGRASHDLLEAAGKQEFRGRSARELRDQLEGRWDSLVAECVNELKEEWPLGDVPEPGRWPGYELTHTRLIASLAEHLERTSAVPAEAAGRRIDTELWLEDGTGVIAGRVDRVEHTPRGSRIIDLKSGWTVRREVTEAQRRQLLIYAYLWHANHGTWPVEAAIQHPDGTRVAVGVAGDEATAEAESLRQARDAYNDRARSGASTGDLAAPSPEACERCVFKASCPYLFASAQPDWDWYRPTVLIGPSQAEHDAGVSLIRGKLLASTSTRTPPPGAVARVVTPARLGPGPQRPLALADAHHPRRSAGLRTAWDSTLSVWRRQAYEAFAAARALKHDIADDSERSHEWH
jgi:hypothetical protein